MSTPRWAPDRPISLDLAARTIAEQFPDLADRPVRLIGAGWDNAVFGVGDHWVFRFIHRAAALEGSAAERAVLASLPPDLPLAVPRPRRVGTPTPEVPWPFWGSPYVPGTELAEADLPDADRAAAATALGSFLRTLHDPALASRATSDARGHGVELRVDPWSRATPRVVVPRVRATLDRLADDGTSPDPAVEQLLDRAAHLGPPSEPPVLVHGDLHIRHVLVVRGRASGVIDWGDAGLGDPAIDLMIGFQAFTGPAREAFFAAYGPVGPDRRLRARTLAVHVAAALCEQADADGMEAVGMEARAALARAAR